VPFPAGGIADVFARIIGGRLSQAWGQPVVVENRAGAARSSCSSCSSPARCQAFGQGWLDPHQIP
jgi:hypothetical protein